MNKKSKEQSIIAYKGFNFDMTCTNNFKYEEGKLYHEDNVSLCSSGFHACTNPADVVKYYEDYSKYHKVELSGNMFTDHNEDSKIVASDIKILEEVTIDDLFRLAGYDYDSHHLGVVDKNNLHDIIKNGIHIGNRITIIDGEYNVNWICVEKHNKEYLFMSLDPIGNFALDTRKDIEHFQDTLFNQKILIPLSSSLENILGDYLKEMELDDNGKPYKCKVTLPSKDEVKYDSETLFTYYKIRYKYNWDNRFCRYSCWLRSVASSSNFAIANLYGSARYVGASVRYYCRPLLKIGE